jgi:hypothetical protein
MATVAHKPARFVLPQRVRSGQESNDGIEIFRLDRWTKHQVISRGWGKLTARDVLVFLPRTNRELETVWKIVQRAYDNLFDPSASAIGAQLVSIWDLPKFSRTTLQ